MVLNGDDLFIGGGEGKVKKLNIASGKWNLTHEAQLDGKVTSLSLSNDNKEVIVGTTAGKLYRMLCNDLSFMVHTDAHCGAVNDISFGSRSDQFACIDEYGEMQLWDSSEYKTTFVGKPGKVVAGTSVCIAEDSTILSGWRDGKLLK
jgi:WD40 repeat protein